MRYVQSPVLRAIAILVALAVVGCSDESIPSSTPSTTTYRGVFVGTSETAALSLTLTSPGPKADRLLEPSFGHGKGTVSGALSFDGVASHPVSGAYDVSKGTITFSAGGYGFSGTIETDQFPAQLVGKIAQPRPGYLSGILHCVPDDGTVAVYTGGWSWSPDRYQAPIGFLTRGNEVAGGVITLFSVFPFYGYQIKGTLGDGPLRTFDASGSTGLDSMALSGYVDTAVGTAGGTYEIIPLVPGTKAGGSWHTSIIGPYGVAVAHTRVP